MEKGINLRIQEFEEDIVNAINKSKLPPRVTNLLLSNYANLMMNASQRAVEVERKTFAEGENTDGESVQPD